MAEKDRITLTVEMIEAGVRELRNWHDELKNWDGAYSSEIVASIIQAALSARFEDHP